ncbi:hypothetical protein [Aquimarina intermedia]|uniref:GLPGLI family protein n=1 Tax=Aquimarina intermedia TaxID=350814 RepID=A0A5S5C4E2_9FLAO|nr:hypothetical protein [Aquimarina intermedia]TYP73478.1 hypothetical protein BD809_10565 [Aquimarina intermedia]
MKYAILLLFVIQINFLKAQANIGASYAPGQATVVNAFSVPLAIRNEKRDDVIQGHPYYEEKEKLAIVYSHATKSSTRCLIRYNALRDQIEIFQNNAVHNMIKREDIKVEVEGEDYYYKIKEYEGDKMFFVLFNEGTNTLALRIEKRIKLGQKAVTNYDKDIPSRYAEKKQYYLIKKDSIFPIRLKKKDISPLLIDPSGKLKAKISSDKLKFKKEEDLIEIIDFYNTL